MEVAFIQFFAVTEKETQERPLIKFPSFQMESRFHVIHQDLRTFEREKARFRRRLL